jgi:hypothetical protein
MRKLALALATTAILGFAAPAFAAESDTSGTKAQTQAPAGQPSTPSAQTQTQTPSTQAQTPSAQTPTAQANVKSKAKVSAKATDHKSKMVYRNRGMNKLAQHERRLHRGHYYAYAKPHHKSLHHSKTMTHS